MEKKEEEELKAVCAEVAASGVPQRDATGQRLAELKERVKGIVADGAPSMWPPWPKLPWIGPGPPRAMAMAQEAAKGVKGVRDASSPDRDHLVAVIHDLVARELPQLVEEHGSHQGSTTRGSFAFMGRGSLKLRMRKKTSEGQCR
jgi:hypothetical protein